MLFSPEFLVSDIAKVKIGIYSMVKIPVYLITGFLGSGKTTFIKQVLNTYASGKKIAVVQNEFAPYNIDGKELKRSSTRAFEILEINNGSVFCVCLLSGFIHSLQQFLKEYNPDILFVETSGLSDPISVGEIFNSPKICEIVYLAALVCIVDATSFLKLEKMQQRMVHQVQVADSILINKTDLAEDLKGIQEKCKAINPQAGIFTSSFCKVLIDDLIGFKTVTASGKKSEIIISAKDLGRPDILSSVLKTSRPLRTECFQLFATAISFKVVRLKGYFLLNNGECKALHITLGQVYSEVLEKPVRQTEMIAMGYELNARALREFYETFC